MNKVLGNGMKQSALTARGLFHDLRVLVVGPGGKTGISATRLLHRLGCRITLADARPAEALQGVLAELEGIPYTLHTGGTPASLASGADLLLLSPGVPRSISLVQEAIRQGKEVIGDVELAWRLMPNTFAGITGTDGKSTTTSMVGSILSAAGRGIIAGNIGIPVLSLVDAVPADAVLCLELSSFQLESCPSFAPAVAAILNIKPDHLDRYPNMDGYLEAKLSLFRNLLPGSCAILPLDDPRFPLMEAGVPEGVERVTFSAAEKKASFMLRDGGIFAADTRLLGLDELQVVGDHNRYNALAATAITASLGIPYEEIRSGLVSYSGLAHRYEAAGSAGGVDFINDSKATTISAVAAAATSARSRAALLLGGKNKELDFSSLRDLLRKKELHLYYFGEAGEEICSMLDLKGQCFSGLLEAVRTAYADQRGTPSAQVILSPGGTSYDEFLNFEERGDCFKALVNTIRQEDGE